MGFSFGFVVHAIHIVFEVFVYIRTRSVVEPRCVTPDTITTVGLESDLSRSFFFMFDSIIEFFEM